MNPWMLVSAPSVVNLWREKGSVMLWERAAMALPLPCVLAPLAPAVAHGAPAGAASCEIRGPVRGGCYLPTPRCLPPPLPPPPAATTPRCHHPPLLPPPAAGAPL